MVSAALSCTVSIASSSLSVADFSFELSGLVNLTGSGFEIVIGSGFEIVIGSGFEIVIGKVGVMVGRVTGIVVPSVTCNFSSSSSSSLSAPVERRMGKLALDAFSLTVSFASSSVSCVGEVDNFSESESRFFFLPCFVFSLWEVGGPSTWDQGHKK